jgi:hypothetical protein
MTRRSSIIPVLLLGSLGWLAGSSARERVATLPHLLHRGPPPGPAVNRHGDPGRRSRAQQLPVPAGARVLWQKQASGGLSGHLLVDEQARIFGTGHGRVFQWSALGEPQFNRVAPFSSALAGALLPGGLRVFSTREGHLLGFSPEGDFVFDAELDVSRNWNAASVVAMPSGGALAALGTWLFHVDAAGALEAHLRWKEPVRHTLIAGRRALCIDELGDVFEWDGYSEPIHRGRFGGRVSAAALSGADQLVAIVGTRLLVQLSLASGEARTWVDDSIGLLPELAVPSDERVLLFRADGARLLVGPNDTLSVAPARSQNTSMDPLELLTSADGSRAWWTPETALVLESGTDDLAELAEVRCGDPISLVALGAGRIAAGCGSGQLWAIGPTAQEGPNRASPSASLGHGVRQHKIVY